MCMPRTWLYLLLPLASMGRVCAGHTHVHNTFIYSKRSAQLVTYPNGAQAPFDPNVALATARHYAAKVIINLETYVTKFNF